MYEGNCYPAGGSRPEVWQSWQICQELVAHFKKHALRKKFYAATSYQKPKSLNSYLWTPWQPAGARTLK
jgi:hypothetical protein